MFRRIWPKKNKYEVEVEPKYSKYDKQRSKILKDLEKYTFVDKITTNKYVSTYDYNNDQLIKILNVYYKKCLEAYQKTIYYITLDFMGESVSFYSVYENENINYHITLNDRISDACKIIKPKEYYDDKECGICYDKADTTLKCGHNFKNSCLVKYIKTLRSNLSPIKLNSLSQTSNTITIECPICRSFIF